MAYFVPYVDESGLHLPTYEDRLADLVSGYQSIFGIDTELSESVPDYQLLSIFAKALDDVSGLVLQAYNSRNPSYATGAALDLLLPQYGLTRAENETDAEVRARISSALAGRGTSTQDALLAALKSTQYVRDVKLFVNDTESTDANGIPAHSIAPVVYGGLSADIANAIFAKKAPGIGTYGSTTQSVTDSYGENHNVKFTRAGSKAVFAYIYIKRLDGCVDADVENAIRPEIVSFINALGIATPLIVPQLYAVAYAAAGDLAKTFAIHDIQVAAAGDQGSATRMRVDCEWNKRISIVASGGVTFTFTDM